MAKKSSKEEKKINEDLDVSPHKDKPVLEREAIESVDSYSLADLPIAPLKYQTSDLANNVFRFEWSQIVNKRKRNFFIEISYGDEPPNADTEIFLQSIVHFGNEEGTFDEIPVTESKIKKLKLNNISGGKYNKAIARHVKALYGINIKTNFIYDRKEKKYRSVECRILSGFEYESDAEGEKKVVTRRGAKDGKLQSYEIDKLKSVSFSAPFVKHFLKDLIPFEFDKYLNLKNPTPRKLYRITNKFISSIHNDFNLDLIHFCATRLGMRSEYLKDNAKISRIAAKLRPDVKRVNDFYEDDYAPLSIAKDKSKPSGYAVGFEAQKDKQLQLNFQYLESMTSNERRVYKLLTAEKVWPNVARKIVMDHAKWYGNEGIEFLTFSLKKFKAYEKNGLKAPIHKRGSVIAKSITLGWYQSDFKEWYSRKQKREEKEEVQRYGNLFDKVGNYGKENDPSSFDLKSFEKSYPDTYKKIVSIIRASHIRMERLIKTKMDFRKHCGSSIEHNCKKCFEEFQKGNMAYFPDMSIYDEEND